MLGLELGRLPGGADRFLLLVDQELRRHADPIIGVGLAQRGLGRPVVVLVDGPDRREQFGIVEHPIEHLLGVELGLVAGAGEVAAGGGDDDLQRLVPGAHAGFHGVDLPVVGVLVILVMDRRTGRRPVRRIADDRLEPRPVGQPVQALGHDLDTVMRRQRRVALGHKPGRPEHLPGLFLRRRPGIDLGTELLVRAEQVETPGRGQERLAVLPRDQQQHPAEPAQPVALALPAEHGTGQERLPGLKRDRLPLPGPAALGVGQEGDESADRLRRCRIEPVGEGLGPGGLQVVEVTSAGLADPVAGGDPAAGYRAGVAVGRPHMRGLWHIRPVPGRRTGWCRPPGGC